MVLTTLELPKPTANEIQQSEKLVTAIRNIIESSDGKISFDRFMDICLYSPDEGYYAKGKFIFGEQGDFITSPEISPLFSQCMANQCEQILDAIPDACVVEFGAGSGAMMLEILRTLESRNKLPKKYYIVDVSEGLIARQKHRLATNAPHLYSLVEWVHDVPPNFKGIIIGNEVLDAMPGRRFRLYHNKKNTELMVHWANDRFEWIEIPIADVALQQYAERIQSQFGENLPDGYITEFNSNSRLWLERLHNNMDVGAVVLIDYGYSRNEWYIPERREGTLMAHYKHHAHPDPFFLPGTQDLTYHVDFTQIAEEAHDCGFHICGFTTQAMFLVGSGLEALLTNIDPNDVRAFLKHAQAIKKLILPQEMGELFKAIGLTKNIDLDLIGFSRLDQRARL